MRKELGIFILLVVLCVTVGVLNPKFLSATNLQNQANLIGMFGIFSIGVAFTIIAGGIDLSIGSLFALQGVLLSMMLREAGLPWPVAALLSIGSMMLLGAFHGFLIAKVRMQPFIVTLCGLLFYRGLARYVAEDVTKGFGNERYGLLRTLVDGKVFGVPMPFVLLIVIAFVMWIVLQRSVYGRYLFAVGRNEEAARYSGIPTRLIVGSAYVISAGLAGVSGILFAFYTNSVSPAIHGSFYELYGIAAAVLGGCSLRGGEGTILGIVIGTALLQVLQNLVNLLGIPSSLNFAVMGAVILIGVLADQVLGDRRRRKVVALPEGAAPPHKVA
jgi:ribose transport system permease protein